MAKYEYTALAPDGSSMAAIVEADSIYEATDLVRSMELELQSIHRVNQDGSRGPRYEPEQVRPAPAPRDVPPGVKGIAGHKVFLLTGGLFTAVATLFILIGIGVLFSGDGGGLFMILFPLLHLGVGTGLLYWAISRKALRRRLYAEGTVAMAKVDAIGYDRSVSVNGSNPLEVVWTFEVDGHTYHDKRSGFNPAIKDFVRGDRLWVIYDPADPENSVEWPPL